MQQRGTDSSSRPIRSSAECWRIWDQVVDQLGFTPTIVQGGHVGDAGAAASAGTHAGDAFDLRLWDRTQAERDQMIRAFRSHGFAYWERYESQNFDLHAHMIPGPWARAGDGAAYQWQDYLAGRDGLAYHGPDYHWRPNPLVLTPPVLKGFTVDKEAAARFDRIDAKQDKILDRLGKTAAIRTRLTALVKQGRADARDLEQLRDAVDELAASE